MFLWLSLIFGARKAVKGKDQIPCFIFFLTPSSVHSQTSSLLRLLLRKKCPQAENSFSFLLLLFSSAFMRGALQWDLHSLAVCVTALPAPRLAMRRCHCSLGGVCPVCPEPPRDTVTLGWAAVAHPWCWPQCMACTGGFSVSVSSFYTDQDSGCHLMCCTSVGGCGPSTACLLSFQAITIFFWTYTAGAVM